jgi:hypothetical protein
MAADALLAVVVALVSVPSAFDRTDGDRPVAVALPLTLLAALPLAMRRRRPPAVLARRSCPPSFSTCCTTASRSSAR